MYCQVSNFCRSTCGSLIVFHKPTSPSTIVVLYITPFSVNVILSSTFEFTTSVITTYAYSISAASNVLSSLSLPKKLADQVFTDGKPTTKTFQREKFSLQFAAIYSSLPIPHSLSTQLVANDSAVVRFKAAPQKVAVMVEVQVFWSEPPIICWILFRFRLKLFWRRWGQGPLLTRRRFLRMTSEKFCTPP